MAKSKATTKTKFTMNGKTSFIEVASFAPSGHISYSGFGSHEDKARKSERRNRKIEENRAKFWRDDE